MKGCSSVHRLHGVFESRGVDISFELFHWRSLEVIKFSLNSGYALSD